MDCGCMDNGVAVFGSKVLQCLRLFARLPNACGEWAKLYQTIASTCGFKDSAEQAQLAKASLGFIRDLHFNIF